MPNPVDEFPEPATVFHENLQRIVARAVSVNAWAVAHKLQQTTIRRLVMENQDPKLSMLLQIADALKLDPWQLLVPGLDTKQRPALRSASDAEQRAWHKVDDLMAELAELRSTIPGGLTPH